VEAMTDNRTRTAANVRYIFDKFGGNLGTTGCVSWSFQAKGVIVVARGDAEEDALLEAALEAGASDFLSGDEVFEIYTEPESFSAVREALESKGYAFLEAGVEQVPDNDTAIPDEDGQKKMQRLLDAMDDDDDVQNVWHNWEN
ncbi:MAG: YebC/PmpR family DNA-binding transcriptional regulator, partial [Oscillospiraceae bacterium]|nr:YebC/PmpR family DNA-binding transcriptional regulator [Oscillospiraceae bacterium]